MKVWKIYIKNIDKDTDTRKYELYAITKDKDILEEFKQTRNMDNFIIKKGNFEKAEYVEFVNDNRGLVLSRQKLATKGISDDGKYIKKTIEVVMTEFEYQNSDTEYVEFIFSDNNWWDYFHEKDLIQFKPKLKLALDKLFFFDHQKIFDEHRMPFLEDDYSAPDYEIDQFEFFIMNYKELFIN